MSENESQCLLYVLRSAYYALFVLERMVSKFVTVNYDDSHRPFGYVCNSCDAISNQIEKMSHESGCAITEQFTAYAALKLSLNLWSKHDVLNLLKDWQEDRVS